MIKLPSIRQSSFKSSTISYKPPPAVKMPAEHVMKMNAPSIHSTLPKSPKIIVGHTPQVPGLSSTPRPRSNELNPRPVNWGATKE